MILSQNTLIGGVVMNANMSISRCLLGLGIVFVFMIQTSWASDGRHFHMSDTEVDQAIGADECFAKIEKDMSKKGRKEFLEKVMLLQKQASERFGKKFYEDPILLTSLPDIGGAEYCRSFVALCLFVSHVNREIFPLDNPEQITLDQERRYKIQSINALLSDFLEQTRDSKRTQYLVDQIWDGDLFFYYNLMRLFDSGKESTVEGLRTIREFIQTGEAVLAADPTLPLPDSP